MALLCSGANAGELLAPGVVSTAHNETSASFTPDRRSVYFMRGDLVSGDTAILVADRIGDGYGNVRIAPFSGVWKDSEPHVSPDGKRLFFVSNRPVIDGGSSLVATRGKQRFPGANLWYVERTASGWGRPVHIDGEVNRVPTVYNPSVAANGNLYFSAHREDSGAAYQVYRAQWDGRTYGAPQRIELGTGVKGNHMDPAIDPQERFVLFAGDEGDSAGSADIYIAFRNADGGWGKPLRLPDPVNSLYLENAPSLGRDFGELLVTSMRPQPVTFPKPAQDLADLGQRLDSPLNGSRNVWRFDISALLREHGVHE
ncbi:TolB family protein [Lysobacter cavernae]|uniref:TolB family protein n=1 Tax=Lysobacter cavernae TaxID=1685901 RepID=A0ABV7RRY5_9GAMM